MIYLIVPPIIIVFAVAILIIFLTKVSSKDRDSGSFVLQEHKGIRQHFNSGKRYLRGASEGASQRIKNSFSWKDRHSTQDAKTAHAGLSNGSGDKIVTLRKRSMVSDKIENGETRDLEELALMTEIEEAPQDSKKYEKLGDYYMEHEQFADARECYKYVLRLDPRHKRAQVAMKNLDRVL
jgi:tetratricopeptide (TPR) repeat protein